MHAARPTYRRPRSSRHRRIEPLWKVRTAISGRSLAIRCASSCCICSRRTSMLGAARCRIVNAQGEFLASLGQPLTRAVADSTLARGLRTEAMFAALVVSLGRIALIKQEDVGPVWTARRELRVPDYRIVLPDGTTIPGRGEALPPGQDADQAVSHRPQVPDGAARLRRARRMPGEAGRLLGAVERVDLGAAVSVRARRHGCRCPCPARSRRTRWGCWGTCTSAPASPFGSASSLTRRGSGPSARTGRLRSPSPASSCTAASAA